MNVFSKMTSNNPNQTVTVLSPNPTPTPNPHPTKTSSDSGDKIYKDSASSNIDDVTIEVTAGAKTNDDDQVDSETVDNASDLNFVRDSKPSQSASPVDVSITRPINDGYAFYKEFVSDDVMQTWKTQFNRLAFGNELKEPGVTFRGKETSSTSKAFSRQDIINTIELLENFASSGSYRMNNKNGYNLRQKYRVGKRIIASDEDPTSNRVEKFLYRHDPGRNSHNKIVCAAEDIFDAILNAHVMIGHKKLATTKNKCNEIYFNITSKQCNILIQLRPHCAIAQKKSRNNTKDLEAARKSVGFRDCIQVDFVDYQSHPCKDHNGVVMRFLMVVKDHFTKYVWLRPIQRKEATLVSSELHILFHEIGFPTVLHGDNGTEFINELVYNSLVEADPDIVTVSGTNYTSRRQDLGGENNNQSIKNLILSEIFASRAKDNDVGWVQVLPQVTSAMNSIVGHKKSEETPYCRVYAQAFDMSWKIPVKERSKIRSIEALDQYIHDSFLSAKLDVIRSELASIDAQEKIITDNVVYTTVEEIFEKSQKRKAYEENESSPSKKCNSVQHFEHAML